MSFVETGRGALLALTLFAACSIGALTLSRRLEPDARRSQRWLSVGLLAAAFVGYPMLVLGAMGVLTLVSVTAVEVGLALAIVLSPWPRRREVIEERQPVADLAAPQPVTPPRWTRYVTFGLYALVAAVAVPRLHAALADPPLAWDSLYYHLPLATEWLQSGALGPLYHPFAPHHGYFPGTGDLFTLWAMLPFHSDLVAGLPSFFFLALGAVALVRIARECGVGGPLGAWLAPIYLLTPAASRVAGTTYVEAALNAMLFTALAYVLAHRRTGRPLMLFFALAALGLAIGVKFTALGYAVVLFVPLAVSTVRALSRRASARRLTALAAACGLVCVLVGGYWYARNYSLGGNPLYPNEVKVAGKELFAGIPKQHGGVALDTGYRMVDGLADAATRGVLTASVVGTSAPQAHELGLGPKVLGVTLLALFALGWLTAFGRGRTALAWVAVLFAGFAALFLLTPVWHVGWLAGNIRFAVPAMALGLVVLFAWLHARMAPLPLSAAVAATFAVPDALVFVVDLPEPVRALLALVGLLVAAAALFLGSRIVRHRRRAHDAIAAPAARPAPSSATWRRRLVIAAVALAGALAVPGAYCLSQLRESRRHERYATAWDLHETLARFYASAWRFLDENLPSGARLAQSGFEYLYPLYGPRLDRRVFYVDVNASDGGAFHAYPLATHRAAPDPDAWLRNLHRRGVSFVAIARPWHTKDFPIEASWAGARPASFHLAHKSAATRVYRLLPPATGSPQ